MNNYINIEGKNFDKGNIKYLTELVNNKFKMVANDDSILYIGKGKENRDNILENLNFNKPTSNYYSQESINVVNEDKLIHIYHNSSNGIEEEKLQFPTQVTLIKKHIAYISPLIMKKISIDIVIKSYTGDDICTLYLTLNYNNAQILREKILDCLR